MNELSKRVVVALDGISPEAANSIAEQLSGYVWGFKVNDLLFENSDIISSLKKHGKVFADAKLHDIPTTVENSVKRLSNKGADIITVHAAGGEEMMVSAKKHAGESKILAVTVLTSTTLGNTSERVVQLTKNGIKANLDGVVCSAQEAKLVRELSEMDTKIIATPGIRSSEHGGEDDQVRIATPQQAISSGVDFLIIGRPLTRSQDPTQTLADLLNF